MTKKVPARFWALVSLVFVVSCGGGGGSDKKAADTGNAEVQNPDAESEGGSESGPDVVSPLVGQWGAGVLNQEYTLSITEDGVFVLTFTQGGPYVYLGKIDLSSDEDFIRPATLRLYGGIPNLSAGSIGPDFGKASYEFYTGDLEEFNELRFSVRSKIGGVNITYNKLSDLPLVSAPPLYSIFSRITLDDMVGSWRSDDALYSFPAGVDYSLTIESNGRLTGSYDGTCALEGQVNSANGDPTKAAHIDIRRTGCAIPAEQTFFPFPYSDEILALFVLTTDPSDVDPNSALGLYLLVPDT